MHLSNFCKALIISAIAAPIWTAAICVWNYFGADYWYYERLIVCLNWNWCLLLIAGGCDSIIKHRLILNGRTRYWRVLFWCLVGMLVIDSWNMYDGLAETAYWLQERPKGWAEVHAVTEAIYEDRFHLSNLVTICGLWGLVCAGSFGYLCWITKRWVYCVLPD